MSKLGTNPNYGVLLTTINAVRSYYAATLAKRLATSTTVGNPPATPPPSNG